MRQIVDAIKFLHDRKIIHRDLKLDNIMVSFDNENDKNNLNMMRGKVKIIDFGFAINMKGNVAFSALGSPINMDPIILKKFNTKDILIRKRIIIFASSKVLGNSQNIEKVNNG